MKKTFNTMFVRPPDAPAFKNAAAPFTPPAGSESANRQQLVLITLRDLLHHSAIPAHWLECQTLLVSSRSRSTGLYILLVMRHWDERLLRYTQAFQIELMERILQFDPDAGLWVHGIAWSFDTPAGTCMFPVLPPKSTWDADQKPLGSRATGTPPFAALPTPAEDLSVSGGAANLRPAPPLGAPAWGQPAVTSDVAQDLAALFAIRDRELNAHAAEHKHPLAFDPTESMPLK